MDTWQRKARLSCLSTSAEITEGDPNFRPGFRAQLLELLRVEFPWAQGYIEARAKQDAVDRQRLLNLRRLAMLTQENVVDMLE